MQGFDFNSKNSRNQPHFTVSSLRPEAARAQLGGEDRPPALLPLYSVGCSERLSPLVLWFSLCLECPALTPLPLSPLLLNPVEKTVKELASLKLALQVPGWACPLSCVALGSHGTSLGLSFLIRKRRVLYLLLSLLFGENEMW